MNREFVEALNLLEKEKGVSKQTLISAIETALSSAYKKDQRGSSDIKVELDQETGEFHIYAYKKVVMEVADENSEINLAEAKVIDPRYNVGDKVPFEIFPKDFGRIAAQTAKQVVVQKIREAERDLIYNEYYARRGEIITGVVRRFEQKTVYVDLGKTEAFIPPHEQIPGEHFEPGRRIKTYLVDVKRGTKSPLIILSRANNGLLKRLLELEVPEIQEGIVEIMSVAREPGARSKVAVYSRFDNVDPVGACVGAKGSRIQMIVRELKGEKIDVILWDEEPEKFITRALSPAKVTEVKLLPSKKSSIVIVPDNQLSLAIGKEGQNARLAARLTGWRIDIKSETQAEEASAEIEALLAEEESITPPTMDWEELISTEDGEEFVDEPFLEEPVDEDEFISSPAEDGEEIDDPHFSEELEEELLEEEEFLEEEPKKKKTRKRSKKRAQELIDELEEGFDLFLDESEETTPEEQEVLPKEPEIIFTEEDTSGFTIGQLLSDELKKKFALSEQEKNEGKEGQKQRRKS